MPINDQLDDTLNKIIDIMVNSMKYYVKHVRIKAEPALMTRWNKKAECVYGADGKIRIWNESIVIPEDDNPVYKQTKDEILANTPAGFIPLWADKTTKKFYGYKKSTDL